MTYAELSTAVRQVVKAAGEDENISDIVERVRETLVEGDAVSLFGTETEHTDLGRVHWIVGHPTHEDTRYMVLAIGSHSQSGEAWPLFTASADDLSDAFRELIAECGTPEPANLDRAAA